MEPTCHTWLIRHYSRDRKGQTKNVLSELKVPEKMSYQAKLKELKLTTLIERRIRGFIIET